MKTDLKTLQDQAVMNLVQRKQSSRQYLRSLSPDQKIEQLAALQEQYYQMLEIREQNGGLPIPEKWQKWHRARHGKPLVQ